MQMKNSIQLCIVFFCFSVFSVKGQSSVQWLTSMGGSSGENNYAVISDGAGNIYTTGDFSLTSIFGGYTLSSTAGANAYVAKLSQGTGSVVWARSHANTGSTGYALAHDASGNIFLAGSYYGNAVFDSYTLSSSGYSDGFIAKINPADGSVVWISTINGPYDDVPYAITVDGAGNVYASGSFYNSTHSGTINITGVSRDAFVIKLDAAGSLQWLRNYGGQSVDESHAIVSDAAGDVYFSGGFQSTVAFGTSTFTSAGSFDIFIAKLDPSNGNVSWAKQYGGTSNDYGLALTCDPSGNLFSTGFFISAVSFDSFSLTAVATDVFICRHDPATGNAQWARRYGGNGYNAGNAISADASGNIYTCGNFSGNALFGSNYLSAYGQQDIFVMRSDAATGAERGAQHFGNATNDYGNGICFDNGNIFVSGIYQGAANFDAFHPSAMGTYDAYVLKMDNTIGLKENSAFVQELDCSPNPFTDHLNLSWNNSEKANITLFDISGKVLLNEIFSENKNLDLSQLDKGIYFVALKSNSGTITKKIIKN
jgi:hypothetical protein